jgi:type II secretory pathway predicted ATPase ExeA
MQNTTKEKIKQGIERACLSLGSANKVAAKCNINASFISQMRNTDKWEDGMLMTHHWLQVAVALAVKTDDWQLAATRNYATLTGMYDIAQQQRMFLAVAEKAGSGKSTTARDYATKMTNTHYFLVEHADMKRGDFLNRLATSLGISFDGGGYTSQTVKADAIAQWLNMRTEQSPLLIIDEADKMGDAALRVLITLYNQLEGRVGCVIMGTEHLKRRFEMGCRWAKCGFDELQSRFGGKFVHLPGVTYDEAKQIAALNGVKDASVVRSLFEECAPVSVLMGNQNGKIIRDVRLLRRKIEREYLRNLELG